MATTFQESLEAHENSRPAWVVTDEDERLWGEGLAYPSAPISSKAALQGFLEAKRRVAAGVPMDGGETNPSVLRHAGSGLVSTNPVAAGYAYEDVRNNRETLGLSKCGMACMLFMSVFMFFCYVAVNAWFIAAGKEFLDSENGYCRELAYWFYVFGIVNFVWMGLRMCITFAQGRPTSPDRDADLGLSYIYNLYILAWSMYAIVLLNKYSPAYADQGGCYELWYALYYIYAVALPTVFFIILITICFTFMFESRGRR